MILILALRYQKAVGKGKYRYKRELVIDHLHIAEMLLAFFICRVGDRTKVYH